MLNKEKIVQLLKSNDKAVARALVVVNGNQTATERNAEATINRNGMGFRPCHARMGSSMAQFFEKRGYLTDKQVAYWRATDKNGDMRIAIYWRQLAEAAAAKQSSKPTANPCVGMDVGNAMEEKMVLEERLGNLKYEYGMILDSDDPEIINPLADEIQKLETRIAQLNEAIKIGMQ